MKFVISKAELVKLIGTIQNVVAQKAPIPILSNFLLEAANGEIILTATDLTVGIRCFAPAKIEQEGATTLPAKRVFQLVRELTAANIEVSTGSNEITEIRAGSSVFRLHGMSRSEFPALPDLEGSTKFKISQEKLREVLFRTSFAVSREDNRYVLTGVLMQVANGGATFVGTDGKRLSKSALSVALDSSFTADYVIPLKAVDEIFKGLTEEGEATVYLMSDKIAVESDDTIVITKLLSGDYPDFNRVIPEDSDVRVDLHREELASLLRQIALFTVDNNHSVRFTFQDSELFLTANNMEVGDGKVSMPVNYHGPKLDIAFNPTFFLDILRHSKCETVAIGITDSYNPGVVTDNSAEDSLFVIMPMRLSAE
ncbi:MAG: DNA polymerase III subunit beta [Waddliaceae bacterium]|nr:DNA polymerase III subunit beta [Waddliaceae bacterium]